MQRQDKLAVCHKVAKALNTQEGHMLMRRQEKAELSDVWLACHMG